MTSSKAFSLAGVCLGLVGATVALAQPGADGEPGTCCGGRPLFEDQEYASVFGPGPVAVATDIRSGPGEFVLHVIDLSGQGSAPINSNWNATPFFHDPSWTLSTLGSVFGVTIDDLGNIYVAHSSVYTNDPFFLPLDALGSGGAGAVYKIDTNTGAASIFATLPNAQDPAIMPASESWSGLGNLHFDCERQNLYVTNHEDGRIYRLDAVGNCASTYDHATDTVGSCAPEAGDTPGFVPLGERVWGVQAHAGRVYYGVWWEDSGRPSADEANEVWSVACDASGEFVGGTSQLEVSVPPFAGIASNPVSDISFGPAGCMLLAERSMANDTTSAAHNSRVLEYCFDAAAGQWMPSANTFQVGAVVPAGLERSSAGGVDYDYAPGGRVWASGDAIQFGPEYVYGIVGLPASGGNPGSGILIDLDQDVAGIDKFQVGDVEISCPFADPCLEVTVEEVRCVLDGSGDANVTFTITNLSGVTAHWLLVPGVATVPNDGSVTVSPNVIPLNPPLPGDGSTSATVSVTVSGAETGETVCFRFALADENVEECCAGELCFEVPDCDCLQVRDESFDEIVCLSDGTVSFAYTFTFDNLTNDVVEHVFLVSQTAGVTLSPDYFDVPSVTPFGSATLTVSVQGAIPGSEVCVLITIHDEKLNECCSQLHCFTAPECPDEGTGACLFCGIPCQEGLSEDECVASGGFYCGDGVLCEPACPIPSGACCVPDGTCIDTIFCECDAIGGVFNAGLGCPEVQCGGVATCPGDCDGDGLVNVVDLVAVIVDWGVCASTPCTSDFNDDGEVDVQDLVQVILNWGACP